MSEPRDNSDVPGEPELVRAAQRGDRGAFARLYESYAPVVHGVLIAHARASEVRDLVHDVFVSALRNLERLDEPAHFGAWLCRIARNRARDDHKRMRPELGLVHEPARVSVEDHGDAELAARVLRALRDLPEAYRETLALRLVEGLSGPQIADRTGMTPGSVRVNLCRGMKLLRERLGELEVPR
ncbi:MAG: sigma-70 family RNA polymerase sigma factor [Planctomycetes bacterium]|nr:sigma-70 family RNA polymerase sigma factor [Planctomycetota bacterium]